MNYSQYNYMIETEKNIVKLYSETWRGKKFIAEHEFEKEPTKENIHLFFGYMFKEHTIGKILYFPNVSSLAELFAEINPYDKYSRGYYCTTRFIDEKNHPFVSLKVIPTEILQQWIKKYTLPEHTLHFNLTVWNDIIRVSVSYSEIISSSWLAEVKSEDYFMGEFKE